MFLIDSLQSLRIHFRICKKRLPKHFLHSLRLLITYKAFSLCAYSTNKVTVNIIFQFAWADRHTDMHKDKLTWKTKFTSANNGVESLMVHINSRDILISASMDNSSSKLVVINSCECLSICTDLPTQTWPSWLNSLCKYVSTILSLSSRTDMLCI